MEIFQTRRPGRITGCIRYSNILPCSLFSIFFLGELFLSTLSGRERSRVCDPVSFHSSRFRTTRRTSSRIHSCPRDGSQDRIADTWNTTLSSSPRMREHEGNVSIFGCQSKTRVRKALVLKHVWSYDRFFHCNLRKCTERGFHRRTAKSFISVFTQIANTDLCSWSRFYHELQIKIVHNPEI